ncbi:MAG: J domain-containing protein [Acidobacteriota bacterium]|nr:J domain-containing protein [Acidobacteriota bacterium]
MTTKPIEAFPLTWPPARERTPRARRARAPFHKRETVTREGGGSYTTKSDLSLATAVRALFREIRLIGGERVVVSTNVELRRDGLPMSGRRIPEDPGAAVYFWLEGKQVGLAIDRWDRVPDNVIAIAKTIEAMRGIERWGSADLMRASFTGFRLLGDGRRPWREVLGYPEGAEAHAEQIEELFRKAIRRQHPDKGGAHDAAAEINAARDRALEELRRAGH